MEANTDKNKTEDLEQVTDTDLAELARQVSEGYTSGRIDSETDTEKQKHIAWELKINVWTD